MTADTIDRQIGEWLAYMRSHPELRPDDLDELEDHLRGRIDDLLATGLDEEEAFLVAVRRMGGLDELTREFAREHSDRLWKQLVLTTEPEERRGPDRRFVAAIVAAVVAAVSVKLPALAGVDMEDDAVFYVLNAGLFALAPLAAYFLWTRGAGGRTVAAVATLFVLGGVGANAFGIEDGSMVLLLTAIHLPIALWLSAGVAYTAGDWRSELQRMDFIRFTGEWFVYYVLIALGGGVLTGLLLGVFNAIGVDVDTFVTTWLLPCGAVGAVVIAAWLVEAKQSVIENIAPVLTRVFTPLFVLALVAFLIGLLATGALDPDRDVLIVFDLLLVVVFGLLLFGISAREPGEEPGWFDATQLALVVTALAVDLLVLIAIALRIGEFGFSANKTAALGENIVLMANLAVSAVLLLGFLRRRMPYARLERWQTGYLVVYAAWAWVVVLAFPLIF